MGQLTTDLCDLCEAERFTELANWREEQGDYKLAAAWLQRAIAIKQITQNVDALELAYDFYNLGLLYSALDDDFNAERFLLKALKKQLSCLGAEHTDTRETISALNALSSSLDVYAFVQAPHLTISERSGDKMPVPIPERRKIRNAC
jgi:tetratricopeptide (TPR) repeat protein